MDAAELSPIRRAFGPADLAPLLKQNGIDASIVVQCRSSVEETEEFLRIAAATPSVIGVVGWADLTDGALDGTLARLRTSLGGNKLVGIRHQVHDEADPDWLLREDVQRGLTRRVRPRSRLRLPGPHPRACPRRSRPRRRFRKPALYSITPPSRRSPTVLTATGPIASQRWRPVATSGARSPGSRPKPSGTTGMRSGCFRPSSTPRNVLARIV